MRRALATLAIAALLAGCGVRGALERPAPMFGKARADYIAAQDKAKAEAAAQAAAGQTPPPPPPEQPIQTSPIQPPVLMPQGVAPSIPPTPAR
jgi:hypothetical protein